MKRVLLALLVIAPLTFAQTATQTGGPDMLFSKPGGSGGSGTVTGTGTANTVTKFTAASVIGNSQITDDGTTVTLPNASVRTAGAGSGTGTLVGTLNVNVTPVTTTDQSEDNLMTYTLPANTLNADGKAIRIRAQFTSSANANNKTFALYFGATKLVLTTAANTGSLLCSAEAVVVRTGAATQTSSSTYLVGAASVAAIQSGVNAATPGETLSGTVVIKGTGINAIAGTITQTLMTVEILN